MAHDHTVLSTRPACLAALKSRALTSDPGTEQANLLFMDGPAHARLRAVVRRLIARLEPFPDALAARIRALVAGLGTEFDLVADFARPVAAAVAGEVLGVELTSRNLDDIEAVTANLEVWFGEGGGAEMPALRLAMLFARAGIVPDEGLTEEERLVTPVVLAHGAYENSRNFLALAGLRLVEERAARELPVRRLAEDAAPARCVYRRALVDAEIAGHAIPSGGIVEIPLGNGNRLPFGFGPHACPGSRVALAEGEIALTALANVLRPGHYVKDVKFTGHPVFHGVEHAVIGLRG